MLVPAGPGSFAGHWAQLPRPQVQSIQSLYVWVKIEQPGWEGRGKSLWLRYTEHGSGVSLTGPVRPWREPRHMSFLVSPCFQAFEKWYRCLVARSPREEPDIAGVEQSRAQQQLCCELQPEKQTEQGLAYSWRLNSQSSGGTIKESPFLQAALHCCHLGLGDKGRGNFLLNLSCSMDSFFPLPDSNRTSRLGARPQGQPSVPASHYPRQRGLRADWRGGPGTTASRLG